MDSVQTDTAEKGAATLSPEAQVEMQRKMWLIRFFEEKAEQLYAMGKVHGTIHLSIGQEASAVGAVAALRTSDYMLSTHRGHGHCIAKGADVRRMMAELRGKVTGYCRGRGGSMHIADVSSGNLGANGIVAGGVPIAVGVGLSIKMQKMEKVILCFFGDGAVHEGAFHESLNMASLWKLPVIYLCENNQYAMSLGTPKALAVPEIAQHASSYNVPGKKVDGNDVMAVYETTMQAVQRARSGEGPSLIEAATYRHRGHSKSDKQLYRTRTEVEEWIQKDPLRRFRQHLLAEGILREEESQELEQAAKEAIEEAVRFAEESPEPPLEDILQGVYA